MVLTKKYYRLISDFLGGTLSGSYGVHSDFNRLNSLYIQSYPELNDPEFSESISLDDFKYTKFEDPFLKIPKRFKKKRY